MDVGDRDEQIYNRLREELVRYASALVGPDSGPDLLSVVIRRVLAKRPLSHRAAPFSSVDRSPGTGLSSVDRRVP